MILTRLKWIGIVVAATVVLFGLLMFVSMVAAVIVMAVKGEHLERFEMTDGDHEA